MNNPLNSYHSKLGPIPLDYFGNDGDPSIRVRTDKDSVVAAILNYNPQLSNRGERRSPGIQMKSEPWHLLPQLHCWL